MRNHLFSETNPNLSVCANGRKRFLLVYPMLVLIACITFTSCGKPAKSTLSGSQPLSSSPASLASADSSIPSPQVTEFVSKTLSSSISKSVSSRISKSSVSSKTASKSSVQGKTPGTKSTPGISSPKSTLPISSRLSSAVTSSKASSASFSDTYNHNPLPIVTFKASDDPLTVLATLIGNSNNYPMYNIDFMISYNENAVGTTSNSEETYYSYVYKETNEIGVAANNKMFTSNTNYYKTCYDPDFSVVNHGYVINREYIIKNEENGYYYTYNEGDYNNFMFYLGVNRPVKLAVPKPSDKASASVTVTGFSDPLDKVAVHIILNDGYFKDGYDYYYLLIPCEKPLNIKWVSTVITATGNKNGVLRNIKEITKFTYDAVVDGVTSTWNSELVYEYNVKDCGTYRVHSPVPSEIADYIAENG